MARHLFVIDPLPKLSLQQDSSIGLMDAARSGGDDCWSCDTDGLFAHSGGGFARCQPAHIHVDTDRFELGAAEVHALGHFDVVWMRKDPPFDLNYIAATWVLELAPPPTRVVNRPRSLRDWNEKASLLKFPELCPPSTLVRDMDEVRRFQADVGGAIVIKPLGFSGGAGIVALLPGDLNSRSLIEMSTHSGRDFILVQKYLPAVRDGDLRVILIDGVARGSLLRVPPPDDLRGNIHVGARLELGVLGPDEQRVCDALKEPLRAAGLLFVGIDLIGGLLTEINITSPTGIREICALGGPDLANELLRSATGAPA